MIIEYALLKLAGRGERIRTSDHVHPMHVRYQAALRPERVDYSRAYFVDGISFSTCLRVCLCLALAIYSQSISISHEFGDI
jgi:hypothetical protein